MASGEVSGLRELEWRLAEAAGPSRELDQELDDLIPGRSCVNSGADFYTKSLDAAVAFAEVMLPGMEYEISTIFGTVRVELPLNAHDRAIIFRKDGNVPLAICEATIRALIANGPA